MKNNFFIVVDCFLGDDLSKVFATKNKSYGSFPEAKVLKLRGCFYILIYYLCSLSDECSWDSGQTMHAYSFHVEYPSKYSRQQDSR